MNWTWITEALKTGAGVSTAFGALGLGVIAGLIGLYFYFKHKTEQIKALPESERTAAIDSYISRYKSMELHTLSAKHKYDILMADTRQRQNIALGLAGIFAIVVIACFAMAVFGKPNPPPQPGPAPAELPVSVGLTAAAPDLPDEIFGKVDDDLARPRQWMRLLDDGAKARLKADEVAPIWLVTGAFEGFYAPFTAHVNAGTSNKVVRCAFLMRPVAGEENAKVDLIPLDEAGESGRAGLYLFKVPTAPKDSRLLVFLGMTKASYDGIQGATKFNVRSRP